MFSGSGLVVLKVSGQGNLLVSSYGALDVVSLKAGEGFTLDTGHLWGLGVKHPDEDAQGGRRYRSPLTFLQPVTGRFEASRIPSFPPFTGGRDCGM